VQSSTRWPGTRPRRRAWARCARGHRSKAWLISDGKQVRALNPAQGMAGGQANCQGPAIALYEALVRFPALQPAFINACNATGQAQPCAGVVGRFDVMSENTAIFEDNHSSSPLLKSAETFFESTNKAAASAKARSLRSSSRSSSLMRLRSIRVAWGLARTSSGSARAAVALVHHLLNSTGYTPCSRHQALLSASGIAAVVITASSRAPAVQARPRAGLDCTCSRQRSSVPTPMHASRATISTATHSGDSNRATALSLTTLPVPCH